MPTHCGNACRHRLHDAQEAPPTPEVQHIIMRLQALLQGQADDLLDVALDMQGISDFHQRVYALVRRIGPGHTRSYGEIANELGDPHAARAIGQAMGLNPFVPIVPCHRVLAAHGRSGGFSAMGGVSTKLRLLQIEQARIGEHPDLFGLNQA
jgi:methylated-DNA-[protein]-cysteine S-methyltransferase